MKGFALSCATMLFEESACPLTRYCGHLQRLRRNFLTWPESVRGLHFRQ